MRRGHGRGRSIGVTATKVVVGITGSSTVRVALAIAAAVGAMGTAVTVLIGSSILMTTVAMVAAGTSEGGAGGWFAWLAFAQSSGGARPDR
jgi:hypothetical protein